MTDIIKYQAGEDTVTLSSDIIRKSLVSGDGKVTEQEVMMFLKLCEYQHLNPFLKEAYLIKYGSSPATMITGKATFLKRAYSHPKYQGHKTGISPDGATAWAEVYVEKYQVPIRTEVDYDEYVGRKKNGEINSMWRSKPRTMLKKVALVQALREAFPDTFAGLYSEEEADSMVEVTEVSEYITEGQAAQLKEEYEKHSVDDDKFKEFFAINTIDELPAKKFKECMALLEGCPAKKKERTPGEDG